MTMSHRRARIAERCGSRLAVWIEAMTRSNSFQAAGPALAERGIVVADQLDRELAAHLALPLLDQRRRDEDQDRTRQTPDHQLRQDQPGLDRLAQADFIAEHGPAAEPPQDGLGRADLVLEQLHVADQRQADEPVEPGMRGQPSGLDRQVEMPRGRPRASPASWTTDQSSGSKTIGTP